MLWGEIYSDVRESHCRPQGNNEKKPPTPNIKVSGSFCLSGLTHRPTPIRWLEQSKIAVISPQPAAISEGLRRRLLKERGRWENGHGRPALPGFPLNKCMSFSGGEILSRTSDPPLQFKARARA